MIINKKKLQELMDKFRLYVESYGNGRAFAAFESNEFLYKQEGYKTNIYYSAKQLFADACIDERDIGTGKIVDIAMRVINLSQNLVNKNQIIHFKNKLLEYPKEAERVIFDIYYAGDERCAFENAVKFFGAKYDLIAYLFFIKDYTRFLPIRPTMFDARLEMLGIDFSTAYKCSWENYIQFITIIESIRSMMEEYYGFTIRLIDAHSFVWHLGVISDISADIGPSVTISFDGTALKEKETTIVAAARIGQGTFRRDLLILWDNSCSVTECNNKDFLIASHIKPWAVCNQNNEWINPYNGLLLTPNLDKAFDQGFISFENNGNIIISSTLSESDRNTLNITSTLKLRKVFDDCLPFLEYHRTYIFRK